MYGENDSSISAAYDDEHLINLISSLSNEPDLSSINLMSPDEALKQLNELEIEHPIPIDEGVFHQFPDLLTIATIGEDNKDGVLEQVAINDSDRDVLHQVVVDTLGQVGSFENFQLINAASPYADHQGGPRSNSSRTTSRSSDEGIGLSPMSAVGQLSPLSTVGQASLLDSDLPDNSLLFRPMAESKPKKKAVTETELCKVCLEKAGKHSYYGGRVCPSCRAFFRRAVQSKYYEIFFCAKGEKCEINLKTRRSCQYCRFKKCLQAGMRIAWVLPDGERNRRFNKLNKAAVRNKVTDSQLVPVMSAPVMSVSMEEIAQIQQIHKTLSQSGCQIFKDFAQANPSFIKEMATISYFGGDMSFEFFKEFMSLCNRAALEMYTAIDEFNSMPPNDRRKLMEVNGPLMNSFKRSACIQEEKSCITSAVDTARKSGCFPVLDEISEKLKDMNLTNQKPIFGYHQFFKPNWAANYDDEKRHFELTKLMKMWPRDNIDSPVDEIQMTLMKLIIAFTTDFVALERPDIVQNVQLRYATLLQKYLKFKYGNEANKRFANGLMMAAYARESMEIMQRSKNQL